MDEKQPKAAGVQNPPSEKAVAAIAAAHSEMVRPEKALVLQLKREPWQAITAICLTPAFYNREHAMPLIFDDGSEKRDVAIPHETVAVQDLGPDTASATAKIAKTYWMKAECVFVADGYEQALWVVPSAAILSAPILVNPDRATLQALGVKTAVVLGDAKPPVDDVVHLADKTAVWKFQLALMAAQGKKCDYVVMTNPHDCDEKLNPNVQWPYLSLAAAPLAAYRQALVQTGDYTGDRKSLHALGGALGDTGDKAKYALVKPVFQKVKDDSYAAEKYLVENGHTPKFLGMVGGAIELPYYICDIHAKYKYWDTQIDYVPADTPYATMRTDMDYCAVREAGPRCGPDHGRQHPRCDDDAGQDLLPQGVPARREVCRARSGRLGKEERGLRRSSLESTGRRRPRRIAEGTFLSRQRSPGGARQERPEDRLRRPPR